MDATLLIALLASIVADSAPLVVASIGETFTERAGVTNLSLDGTILLSAMIGFAVAMTTDNLILGFAAAMLVGALVALIVAVASIELRQSQVAVGFVLTMLCADLSSFLGNPFVRKPGPAVAHLPVPVLDQVPVLGTIFFDQNPVVYISLATIAAGLGMDLPHAAGADAAGRGRASGGSLRPRRERPLAAVRLHSAGRRHGGIRRGCLLSEREAGVELPPHVRHGLDRPGHRHLRRLGPAAGRPGGVPVSAPLGRWAASRRGCRRSPGCCPRRSCRRRRSP